MPKKPKQDLHIKGVDNVVKNLSAFELNVVDEIATSCEAVQAKVIREAQGIVPVKTSKLQRSIQPAGIIIEDVNVTALVAATAEYASYVEYGTTRMVERPYLVPALYSNQETFRRAIIAAVKRAKAA